MISAMATAPHFRPREHGGRGFGKRPGGFTLVEIVVAIMLLTLVATTLAGYMSIASRSRVLAKQRALALVAAQEAIDIVRSTPFDAVVAGTQVVTSSIGNITVTVTTTIEISKPKLKLVGVRVRNAGGTELQYFRTAIFRADAS